MPDAVTELAPSRVRPATAVLGSPAVICTPVGCTRWPGATDAGNFAATVTATAALPEGKWQLYARFAEISVVPAPEALAAMPTVPASTAATSTSAAGRTGLRERGGDPADCPAVLPTRTSPPF